jgi:anti-sigma B factor antagonist
VNQNLPLKLIDYLGVAIIRLFGDLDMEDMVCIKNIVATLIGDGRGRIVVDFARVQHINATGLGILAERLRTVRLSGGDLRLAGLNPYITSVFELTGLKKSFRTFDSCEAAAQSFGSLGVAA